LSQEKVSRRGYVKYAGAAVVVVAGAAAGAYYATRPPAGPIVTTETTGAAENPPDVLQIAYDFAPCEAIFFIAIDKGYFADEGMSQKVEIFPCETAAELRESIHSGHAIAGYCAYEFIPAIDEGADFRYVMGAHTGCHEIFVSNKLVDQGVTDEKSLADYIVMQKNAGKKPQICISAVGNSPYFFTAFFLENHGMSLDDVEIVVYEMGAVPVAMKEGAFDIACEWDTIPRIVEREGIGKIVVDPAIHAPYNELYCCYIGMNNTFTEKYPETTLKFVKALARAGNFITNNPQEAAEIHRAAGEELCPYTVDELAEGLAIYHYDDAGNVEREIKTLQVYAGAAYRAGLIRHDGDWIVEHGMKHLLTPPYP